MANPVLKKLDKEFATTTPNGYPSMPGYEVGGDTATQTRPTYDQQAWQDATDAMQAPAADAVDRGRMTYDDAVVKTGITFGVLFLGALVGWFALSAAPTAAIGITAVASIATLVLAFVITLSKRIRPAVILTYAALEGFSLGAVSAVANMAFPGVVVQALLATVAVVAVTLTLMKLGIIKPGARLSGIALVGLFGIIGYGLVSFIASATGLVPGGFDQVTVAGIPLGIIIGLIAVVIGAVCLVQDVGTIQHGVAVGAPREFAWMCAFGLMVTIVWMYLEILRILMVIADNAR